LVFWIFGQSNNKKHLKKTREGKNFTMFEHWRCLYYQKNK